MQELSITRTLGIFETFWNRKPYTLKVNNDKRTLNNFKKLLRKYPNFEDLDNYIERAKNSKETLRRIAVAFYDYLDRHEGIKIESSLYSKRFFDYPFERQLEIAKFLHEPHDTGEIKQRFDIDERTVRSDIAALRDGIEVMGTSIRIEEERRNRKKYYKSTLHPIFLPLNLTEVYALSVYMPRMMGKFDPNARIVNDIVQRIKAQLSDYAKRKLFPEEEENSDYRVNYRNDEDLARSSEGILMYLMKSGRKCSLFLNGEKKVGSVVDYDGRYRIRMDDGSVIDAESGDVEFIIEDLKYE